MFGFGSKATMVDSASALPGRNREIFTVPTSHAVLGSPLHPEDGDLERIYLAMGCFWGAEELYWQLPGVAAT
ncbi:MAG: peptide-methionine (S)-S-oxide reductase, partial [Actinomycetota bacterium]|nr:peptide-methionine (S)-S-oxide reductase [Actinomycetota bacterium]